MDDISSPKLLSLVTVSAPFMLLDLISLSPMLETYCLSSGAGYVNLETYFCKESYVRIV